MEYIINIIIFLASFAGMEFVAWFSHKYIMHGFLWHLHKDHHTGSKKAIEKNDWFALIFAIPSCTLIAYGIHFYQYHIVSIGLGMAAYGLAYFFVHDIYVHQRIKLFRNLNGSYFKALKRAHKIHHKNIHKENAESFGFLFVSKKYFKDYQ